MAIITIIVTRLYKVLVNIVLMIYKHITYKTLMNKENVLQKKKISTTYILDLTKKEWKLYSI